MAMRLAGPIALLLTVTACGADSSSVGLEALSIDDRSGVEGYHPGAPGEILVGVRVRLLNAGASALPIDAGRFTLWQDEGTPTFGDPLTAWLDDGCAGEVPAGERADCVVAFALPAAFEPTRIVYAANGERAEAAVSFSRPPPGDGLRPTDELDLLVMVDNSGSLTEELAAFNAELPRLFRILGSGDLDGDGRPDFDPFDVHAAVVTSDMGVGGHVVPTCTEDGTFGDDGILKTEGNTAFTGCAAAYPGFLAFEPGADAETVARDLACLMFDSGGCGFEQPLEAVLKAVSPSAPTIWTAPGFRAPAFFMDTRGHADTENAGFVRPDSVLAVFLLSDEDDCSASDPALFDLSPDGPYAGTYANLRCFAHAEAALHPLSRFVDGLLGLRRSPRRLVFAPMVGFPADLEPAPGERPYWDALISEDPALRDDRMEERIDPSVPSRLVPSCTSPTGIAMPPIRTLRVAHQLESRGARVAIGSACQNRYQTAFDATITQIVAAGRGDP